MNAFYQYSIGLALVVIGTACGVIPSEYRGEFRDSESGASLKLKGRKGVFQTADGRKIESKAKDLEFEKLAQAQGGIYVSSDPGSDSILEVYWVSPDVASRQEAAQLVWFRSEVIYTELNLKTKDKVNTLEFFHCREGTILLDLPTKRWQMGCPGNADYLRMQRVKD
ncbi:MAG: hypothetical protein A2X94_13510 [Bdellovibrionales bacterium GWB1_55_8]|nr:MAG: hypothetical protein A2X94_13510 [Bdellovibrionales bacterium GWB1_55_8]